MLQDRWTNLAKLLRWFRDGSDADGSAEIAFSPQLTKEHRATIHRWSLLVLSQLALNGQASAASDWSMRLQFIRLDADNHCEARVHYGL